MHTDGYDELRQQAERARVDAREARSLARRHAELIVARVEDSSSGRRGAGEGGSADPRRRVFTNRYDEVRQDAERARADAQAAIDAARRRHEDLAGLLQRAGRGGGPRREDRLAAAAAGVSDRFVAVKSAQDRERRARERAARAHDRAAREHDRMASVYEGREDEPRAARERAAGVRERQAAEQDRRAAQRPW
jgi:hypothetical protein